MSFWQIQSPSVCPVTICFSKAVMDVVLWPVLLRIFLKRRVWSNGHNAASRYHVLIWGLGGNRTWSRFFCCCKPGLSGFRRGHRRGTTTDGCFAVSALLGGRKSVLFMRARRNKYSSSDAQGELRLKAEAFFFLSPGVLFGIAPIFPLSCWQSVPAIDI